MCSQQAGAGGSGEGTTNHGHHISHRVFAYCQLESVECPRQRRQKRGLDGTGCAAAEERAQIVAAEAEALAELMPEPICVYPASRPIDAPAPLETSVCNPTTALSVRLSRPP